MQIRKIQKDDDPLMAAIVRKTLEEFGADKPGTVYYDETTDRLSSIFEKERSSYFVVIKDGKLMGGAGVYPTEGLPENTAELVKLYLVPEARGLGIGKLLINTCFETAKELGYEYLYLETMPELNQAVGMYSKLGFQTLAQPLGSSGHHYCSIWMLKKVNE